MPIVVVDRRWAKRLIAAWILGVVFGFFLAYVVAVTRIDQLTLALQQSTANSRSLQAQVDALEESLAQKKKNPIKELKVTCLARNEHTRLAVESFVYDLLSDLLGKDYTQMDPTIVYKAVEDRPMHFENQQLMLNVETLLIWEVVTVVVNASAGKVN